MTAADKLKEIRRQHGYSQKQTAERIGVSAGAVCRWEKGERDISEWVIKAYSRVFQVPESYFTEQLQEETPKIEFTKMKVNRQEERLLAYFRQLSALEKEEYLKRLKERSVSESDTEE